MPDSGNIFIKGPSVLKGPVKAGGSKNASLAILAATLVTDEKCVLRNIPRMTDISVMLNLLELLGKKVAREGSAVIIENGSGLRSEAPYDLVKKLRASILVMGALAGRKSSVSVSLPGGCAIGTRPIDLHLKGLVKMGASYRLSGGFINLSSKGLRGKRIYLDYPSVGATENLLAAACRAEGETVIENISREPEVIEMVRFVKQMGVQAEVSGDMLRVSGRRDFNPVDFTVMDDRIQAGTYAIAGCLKNSAVDIEYSNPEHLEPLLDKLRDGGASVTAGENLISVRGVSRFRALEITTAPYPGFPTDLQAPLTALLTRAKGVSVVTEKVFENRFLHCAELSRMGAEIEVKGESAIISGRSSLSGAPVNAMDLRGGAALVIAGMMASGKTRVSGIQHIERGYDNLAGSLRELGADIWTK